MPSPALSFISLPPLPRLPSPPGAVEAKFPLVGVGGATAAAAAAAADDDDDGDGEEEEEEVDGGGAGRELSWPIHEASCDN